MFILPHLKGLTAGNIGSAVFKNASLDLKFADNKSLVDAVTGASLVTFTRASSGTFVDSAGVLQTAVTNLLLRSEEFNDASWTKSATSIVSNDTTSPSGLLTADKLVEDSANSQHTIGSQAISWLGNTQYTFTVYVKAAGRDTFDLLLGTAGNWVGSNRVAIFNLTSGTVEAQDGSPVVGSIQNVGDGWFRCRVTSTAVASPSASAVFLRLYNTSVFSGGVSSYLGNGTSGVYIWGAQLEQSATVGEYIPTTSAINSAPRFDHNPTTGESLGLLVEEQRTNSIRNNTMVGAVAGTPGTLPTNWAALSTITGITAEIVGTGTSNGITYIDIKLAGTSSAASSFHLVFDANTATAASTGQTWTSSSYLALVAGSFANIATASLRCTERAIAGSFVGTSEVSFAAITSSLSNNRTTVSRSLGATAAFVQGGIIVSVASDAAIDITLRIGLPQLEQGAFATSPILTSTAAATRSADVASITGTAFSGWYRQDEGTVFCDALGLGAGVPISDFQSLATFSDGTNATRIELGYLSASSAYWNLRSAGLSSVEISPTVSAARRLLAASYSSALAEISVNGAAALSDSSVTVPLVNKLDIGGANGAAIKEFNGHIRRLTFFPQRLPNSTLQALTQ